jgi:hypothetical protein
MAAALKHLPLTKLSVSWSLVQEKGILQFRRISSNVAQLCKYHQSAPTNKVDDEDRVVFIVGTAKETRYYIITTYILTKEVTSRTLHNLETRLPTTL